MKQSKTDTCSECGAKGRRCYGNDEQGPEHDDWIGKSEGRDCCHACHEE